MRIYGKTLPEIYNEMPSAYKFIVVVSSAAIFLIIAYVLYQLLAVDVAKKNSGALFLPGRQEYKSFYDPALASNFATGENYLIYNNMRLDIDNHPETSIDLAFSTSPCTNWVFKKRIFQSHKDDLIAPNGIDTLSHGEARYETPSIVHDPKDKGREWKIFVYRYFWAENLKFAQRYSTISMKTASDPINGEWSTEEWILSAAPDFPPSPYQEMVAAHINTLDKSLAGFISYGRPSVINIDNILYMSLSAFTGAMTPERIILLSSSDHARSWQYRGALLNAAQIKQYGDYTKLGGGTLLVEDNKPYLAAVFGNNDRSGMGTFIFAFDDITKASLQTKNNVPKLLRQIKNQSISPTNNGGGYAAYTDTCNHGVMVSELSGIRGTYQIFKTAQKVSSEDE